MRLEGGEYAAPSPDNLARIAEVLDIEMADLYAMADYVVPRELPSLKPYLRSKYSGLPIGATNDIEAYARRLAKRHGVDLAGPAPGEDEESETTPKATKRATRSRTATKSKTKGGTK